MDIPITYITHADIDRQRWNSTMESSANGLAYAHTDMLDAMSPNWDALVYGNYEAIMPLTWRKKMGIRYLCQPAFCQQLGIFSAAPIPAPLVEAFLLTTAAQFRLIEIFINHANPLTSVLEPSTNFILPLKNGYESIKENYRNDLQKNLKRAAKYPMVYNASNDIDEALTQYRNLYGRQMNIRDADYNAFARLCKKWIAKGRCFVREVHLQEENKTELLAIGIFLKDQHRIYNIASSTLPNGRTLEANHFLFDQLIGEFEGQDILLDFEGSDLPGVARFYQKFNPINQPYFFWKSNRLPAVMRWWKK